MSTRLSVREEIERRLGDVANTVWTDAELNGYIENAIKGLYPTFFRLDTTSSVAGAGPLQNLPAGARNLYQVAVQTVGSTRPIPVLGWTEGSTQVTLPVSGINGATILWSWSKGFTVPADDVTVLDVYPEAEEALILRVQIVAIQDILTSRVKLDKYFALNVRQAVSENDIGLTLDALEASLADRVDKALKLPETRR